MELACHTVYREKKRTLFAWEFLHLWSLISKYPVLYNVNGWYWVPSLNSLRKCSEKRHILQSKIRIYNLFSIYRAHPHWKFREEIQRENYIKDSWPLCHQNDHVIFLVPIYMVPVSPQTDMSQQFLKEANDQYNLFMSDLFCNNKATINQNNRMAFDLRVYIQDRDHYK